MSTERDHDLSTFTLDVYWASGRPADAAIERHLRACARCVAYLASLDEGLDARRPAIAGVGAPRPRAPRARWAAWAWPAAAAVSLAAAWLLVVRPRGEGTRPYVGVKGTPAVQLLVHRGEETRVWDGVAPVRPGDALALRVACEGMDHVTVAALDAGQWKRLSETACPAGDAPLPFTLVVDAEPGDERFAVVLGRGAPDDAALERALAHGTRSADVWVADFTLSKETGVDR